MNGTDPSGLLGEGPVQRPGYENTCATDEVPDGNGGCNTVVTVVGHRFKQSWGIDFDLLNAVNPYNSFQILSQQEEIVRGNIKSIIPEASNEDIDNSEKQVKKNPIAFFQAITLKDLPAQHIGKGGKWVQTISEKQNKTIKGVLGILHSDEAKRAIIYFERAKKSGAVVVR